MRHIRISVLMACACFASAAWGQQPATNSLNNWSEFHYLNMMRYNPYENILNIHNVEKLQLKWNYFFGGGVFSSPAVVNGVVYGASGNGNVYAMEASTGALLWSYDTGSGPPANQVWDSLAVANGVVYFGTYLGTVYALEANTGIVLWTYATGAVDTVAYSSPPWQMERSTSARPPTCTR